jgi:hypothetical protein
MLYFSIPYLGSDRENRQQHTQLPLFPICKGTNRILTCVDRTLGRQPGFTSLNSKNPNYDEDFLTIRGYLKKKGCLPPDNGLSLFMRKVFLPNQRSRQLCVCLDVHRECSQESRRCFLVHIEREDSYMNILTVVDRFGVCWPLWPLLPTLAMAIIDYFSHGHFNHFAHC